MYIFTNIHNMYVYCIPSGKLPAWHVNHDCE